LEAGSAALGVGGELVYAHCLKSGDTAPITDCACKLIEIVLKFRSKQRN